MPDLEAEIFTSVRRFQISSKIFIHHECSSWGYKMSGGSFGCSAEENEKIIRELEENFTVRQSIGSSVLSEYKLLARRERSENRIFLLESPETVLFVRRSLPPVPVISVLDNVTVTKFWIIAEIRMTKETGPDEAWSWDMCSRVKRQITGP